MDGQENNPTSVREEYGVPFRNLGPVQKYLGVDMRLVGGSFAELEAGIQATRPAFYDFLLN